MLWKPQLVSKNRASLLTCPSTPLRFLRHSYWRRWRKTRPANTPKTKKPRRSNSPKRSNFQAIRLNYKTISVLTKIIRRYWWVHLKSSTLQNRSKTKVQQLWSDWAISRLRSLIRSDRVLNQKFKINKLLKAPKMRLKISLKRINHSVKLTKSKLISTVKRCKVLRKLPQVSMIIILIRQRAKLSPSRRRMIP